jgi:DNA-binding transcriptional regulator YiaG
MDVSETCPWCRKPLEGGRSDKKYHNPCKDEFHTTARKVGEMLFAIMGHPQTEPDPTPGFLPVVRTMVESINPAWVREMRRRSGLSLRATAKVMGLSHTYLSDIENGHSPLYGSKERERIIEYLKQWDVTP